MQSPMNLINKSKIVIHFILQKDATNRRLSNYLVPACLSSRYWDRLLVAFDVIENGDCKDTGSRSLSQAIFAKLITTTPEHVIFKSLGEFGETIDSTLYLKYFLWKVDESKVRQNLDYYFRIDIDFPHTIYALRKS